MLALAVPPPCGAPRQRHSAPRTLLPANRRTQSTVSRPSRLATHVSTLGRQPVTVAALPGSAAGQQVAAFYEAFNQRSVPAMLDCLSADPTYHNLGYPEPCRGRQAVEAVLASLVSSAPPSWQLIVDDATGDASAAAVVYHLQDASGRVVPLSSGIAFYRLDQAGRICTIVESSEQVFKVPQAALPALGAAAPLLQALSSGPLGGWLPNVPPAAPGTSFSQAAGGLGSGSRSSSSSVGTAWAGEPSSSSSSSSNFNPTLSAAQTQCASAVAASSSSSAEGQPSSSSAGGQLERSRHVGDVSQLAGVWIKDLEASDAASYSRACDLMGLSGLQKTTATQLIEGVEIELGGSQVAVRFLTVVPFFKVTEAYSLAGPAAMARRDLRGGSQQAVASVDADGSLEVQITWGEPNAATIREVYSLEDGQTLVCLSTVTVAAGSVTTRNVYRRSGDWRPRFQWNPLYNLMGSQSQ